MSEQKQSVHATQPAAENSRTVQPQHQNKKTIHILLAGNGASAYSLSIPNAIVEQRLVYNYRDARQNIVKYRQNDVNIDIYSTEHYDGAVSWLVGSDLARHPSAEKKIDALDALIMSDRMASGEYNCGCEGGGMFYPSREDQFSLPLAIMAMQRGTPRIYVVGQRVDYCQRHDAENMWRLIMKSQQKLSTAPSTKASWVETYDEAFADAIKHAQAK
jgi:hypothetical protein